MTGNMGRVIEDRGDENLLVEIELRERSGDPLANTAAFYGTGTRRIIVPRDHVYPDDVLSDW